MPSWDNDTKAGKLTKRMNNLLRISMGSVGNVNHALDLVLQEVPQGAKAREIMALKDHIDTKLCQLMALVSEVNATCEKIKVIYPDYRVKEASIRRRECKKRKGK